ncbi:universal stress protein [Nocardia sp. BMG111209]|uniref:universal stress protein n=1 Tax=Nocardia sp. BMG111209 TaxID=1160137 RepID=UPI00035E471A|nr:universal stress protein [Nocardia sp. BMG111209]
MTEERTPEWAPIAGSGFELGTDGPRVIMAGLDGSDSSWRAAAYAAGTARRQHAQLALVYVQPLLTMAGAYGVDVRSVTEDVAQELARELRQRTDEVRDVFRVPWTFLTRRGDPYAELARAADELKADAVMVGASEHTGHRIVGSVAVRLVKAGRWPVTVVP